jgi:hypothetical protein
MTKVLIEITVTMELTALQKSRRHAGDEYITFGGLYFDPQTSVADAWDKIRATAEKIAQEEEKKLDHFSVYEFRPLEEGEEELELSYQLQ